jgi:hypothetical protein
MPQPLQHRRGATLPASLAAGEFFFKTDTAVWYSGPAGGGAPIPVGPALYRSEVRFATFYSLGVLSIYLDPAEPTSFNWDISTFDGTAKVVSDTGLITGAGTGTFAFNLRQVEVLPGVLYGEGNDGNIIVFVGGTGYEARTTAGVISSIDDGSFSGLIMYRRT